MGKGEVAGAIRGGTGWSSDKDGILVGAGLNNSQQCNG